MKNVLSNFVLPIICLFIILLLYQKQNIKIINEQESNTIYVDIEEAKKAASDSKKEILIVFEAPWSESSEVFKKNLKDSIVKEAVKDYVICLIDYDKDRDSARKFNIKTIPSYIVVDEKGEIKKYGSGYKTKNIFLNWLRSTKK